MELLIVVVLLGLAATTVAVELDSTTDTARLRAATTELEQTLRLARHQAGKTHRPSWLQLELGTGHYRLVLAAQKQTHDFPWHTLEGVTVARAAIGRRSAEAPTPTPTNRETIFTIRVSPTGATLPWAVGLHAGGAKRVVWSDGITGRLAYRDGIALTEADAGTARLDIRP